MFSDREDAARALAQRLAEYRGRNPLILAIPRGAVPMGEVLADSLQGELDLVLVHKIGAPFDPEYAVGAIDESGWSCLDPAAVAHVGGPAVFEEARNRQLAALKKRRARYTPFMQPIDPKGRIAIVVDDGLATGATMIAALHAVRAREPLELVCAVPVAAGDSLEKVAALADRVVCLHPASQFGAVSHYYARFVQVEDDEVTAILKRQRAARGAKTS